MSEKAPQMTSEAAAYRERLNDKSNADLYRDVIDLVDDRVQVSVDRLRYKAGTTINTDGADKSVGGRFARTQVESRAQLEDIAAFEDQIRLGVQAKELAEYVPAIETVLEHARTEVERMNAASNTKSTLKEVGVIRHALVESKAMTALEVGNMSNEDIETLFNYMQMSTKQGGNQAEGVTDQIDSNFKVGQSVRVLQPNGRFEDGWYVGERLDGNNYKLQRDEADGTVSTKTVPEAKLALWNDRTSDLTAPDAPARDAVVDMPTTADSTQDAVARPELTPPDAPAHDAVVDPRIKLSEIIKSPAAYLASRVTAAMMYRRNKEADGSKEKSRNRRWMLAGVGAAAVAAAAYLSLRGHDTSHLHGTVAGNSFDTPLEPVGLPGTGGGATGVNHEAASTLTQAADHAQHFSKEASTAGRGEGWVHQLREMGFSEKQISGTLKKLQKTHDPAVREWVYTMEDGKPGIAKPGKIPMAVLQSIEKMRSK